MTIMFDAKKIRKDFPMFRRKARTPFVYLDSAASSQTPESVLKAMDAFYRECRANVHRGMYPASAEATDRFEAARLQVARFLNAAPEEVIFTRGATEALNLLAYAISKRLGPGDEVVLSIMEHHSNLVPWQQLAKQRGFAVRFIGLTPDSTLDLEQAKALIGPKTRVVSAMHVSNALGTVLPVRELAALAHKNGALMIVDAAQSLAHRPVDVKELGCDFLAFSGHKMFGPTGIGALYGRRAELEKLDPFMYGGDMILEVSKEDAVWNDLPWKFEAGTPNIAGAIGLGAAAEYAAALGPKRVAAHEKALVDYAMKKIGAVTGCRVFGPPAGVERGGVVSFAVGDIHPHDLTNILASAGVCVRGGHHCAMPLMRELGLPGTTRASFSAYNDRSDVDALVEAIWKAKKIFDV